MSRQSIPIEKRFWQYVAKGHEQECWTWTGSTYGTDRGYGAISMNGVRIGAHRASWILHNGPIPEGMEVCHKCDNGLCVNPAHLWLGTHAENMRDRSRKGRTRTVASDKHHSHKLTWEEVEEIRRIYRQGGISQRALAERFNVAQPNICEITRGSTWNPDREEKIS